MTIDKEIHKINEGVQDLRGRTFHTDRTGLYAIAILTLCGAVTSCTKLERLEKKYDAMISNQQQIMQSLGNQHPTQHQYPGKAELYEPGK
jgi:hypothetical protein